jgi:predicted RNase H-like nuclease (RuvC/YqgF family)
MEALITVSAVAIAFGGAAVYLSRKVADMKKRIASLTLLAADRKAELDDARQREVGHRQQVKALNDRITQLATEAATRSSQHDQLQAMLNANDKLWMKTRSRNELLQPDFQDTSIEARFN